MINTAYTSARGQPSPARSDPFTRLPLLDRICDAEQILSRKVYFELQQVRELRCQLEGYSSFSAERYASQLKNIERLFEQARGLADGVLDFNPAEDQNQELLKSMESYALASTEFGEIYKALQLRYCQSKPS